MYAVTLNELKSALVASTHTLLAETRTLKKFEVGSDTHLVSQAGLLRNLLHQTL
jgi:hypothetical protein